MSHLTTNTYDGDRRLTSVQDANLHTTTYIYDLDGEQTEVDRQDGSHLLTGYDGDGNVVSQTDGLSHATSYGYDALNRKTSMTDALNRTTGYGYDAAGNLTGLTDAKGQVTSYRYDAGNQLLAIAYSDARTPNVSFSYDALGQRLSMVDGTGTTSYAYDSLRRLTQSTNGVGAQVGYGYDLKGQLTSLTYPGTTGTVTRSYDDAGRLQTVADWLGHSTGFGYDPNSNLTTITYPNTVVATYTYNNADQLTGISDVQGGTNTLLSFSYGRDPIGQLTSDGPKSYGYDTINRLQTYNPGANTTYTIDNADRITQIATSGGNTTALAYDNADQLQTLTVSNGNTQLSRNSYGFDPDGNRTSVTDQNNVTTNLGYDQANRLVAYGTGATYAYNGDGLRTSKTVSGSTSNQTWDIAEGLPLVIQDGATSYVTGPGGLPLEQVAGSTVYYFHQDQLGSTRALTDSTGVVQQSYDYDPYGSLIASTGTIGNPFRYAGQYLDTESSLYYLRARFYDPTTFQFATRDSALAHTREAFGYVGDSPLGRIDPLGLNPFWCGLSLFGLSLGWGCLQGSPLGQLTKPNEARPSPSPSPSASPSPRAPVSTTGQAESCSCGADVTARPGIVPGTIAYSGLIWSQAEDDPIVSVTSKAWWVGDRGFGASSPITETVTPPSDVVGVATSVAVWQGPGTYSTWMEGTATLHSGRVCRWSSLVQRVAVQ